MFKKSKAIIVISFWVVSFMCYGDNLKNSTDNAVQIHGTGEGHWIQNVYSKKGVGSELMNKLPYQLYCPEGIKKNVKIPLVIFLHGTESAELTIKNKCREEKM